MLHEGKRRRILKAVRLLDKLNWIKKPEPEPEAEFEKNTWGLSYKIVTKKLVSIDKNLRHGQLAVGQGEKGIVSM